MGINVAHFVSDALSALRLLNGFVQQLIGSNRRVFARNLELAHIIAVCAGAHGNHDITDLQILMDGAGGSDPDNVLDIIAVEQLIGINADGRHAHAAGHDRYFLSLIGTGKSQHTSDLIDTLVILQIGFGDEFGPERIAGHQDCFGKIAFFSFNVRCRNRDA